MLLAVGRFAFGVTIAGNLLSLVPLIVLGALCFIAIGLLVGSVAKTEDAAAAMANLVTLPMTFLAGVFFPLDSAPGVVQDVSKVLPLTYLANGLRGVAVRDHSFMWTLPKLGVLAAFGIVDRRRLAPQLPLDLALMLSPIVVPWASQYFASGMQEGPDAVLEAMGSPAATRVEVPTLADALAGPRTRSPRPTACRSRCSASARSRPASSPARCAAPRAPASSGSTRTATSTRRRRRTAGSSAGCRSP